MCAKKVRAETMDGPDGASSPHAHGPRPTTAATADAAIDDEMALRILRSSMTWREWLLYDFLRYWYGLGALALLAFSVTYIAWEYHVRDAAGLAVLAVGGTILAALEVVLYRAIWPRGAFTEGWPMGRRLRMFIRRLRWNL
ncbi:MAG: hypothetical protein MUE55_01430 [Thermoplasmata archaeon]|jgi:hypothetical protein|nr:hypothetical protein [Thermoplasmata archaeon]